MTHSRINGTDCTCHGCHEYMPQNRRLNGFTRGVATYQMQNFSQTKVKTWDLKKDISNIGLLTFMGLFPPLKDLGLAGLHTK